MANIYTKTNLFYRFNDINIICLYNIYKLIYLYTMKNNMNNYADSKIANYVEYIF